MGLVMKVRQGVGIADGSLSGRGEPSLKVRGQVVSREKRLDKSRGGYERGRGGLLLEQQR